jgi:hypothetical protein
MLHRSTKQATHGMIQQTHSFALAGAPRKAPRQAAWPIRGECPKKQRT